MFCSKCGQDLHERATVCPNCKSSVSPQTQYLNGDYRQERKSINSPDIKEQINTPDIPDFYRRKSRKQGGYYSKKEKASREVAVTQSQVYEGTREDSEERPPKGGWFKSFFIGLAVLVLLICAGIFSAYYAYNRIMGSSTEEYLESVSKINSDINALNDDVFSLIAMGEEGLPTEDILAKVDDSYKSLNSIIESASEIAPPAKYGDSHSRLTRALEQNKLIYKQLETILKNPADPEIQKNMEVLAENIDEAMTNYTAISLGNLSFSLPDKALSVPQIIQPWIDQKQVEYAQVMSMIQDFTQYFDNISKVLMTYSSAETNFIQIITAARSGQESWDVLFSKIEESEAIIKNATSDYGKIPVPSQLRSFNKRFAPVLDDLMTYFSELRFAAATERDFVNEYLTDEELAIVMEEIDKLYQDAEKFRTSSSQNYQKFAADMNIEKGKYLDPEYVKKLKK